MAAIKYTGTSDLVYGSDEALTTVYASTDQQFTLNQKREEDGKVYRFVKYTAGTATVVAVAGNLVYWTATAGTVVGDESDSSIPAGILMGVIAANGFGWIQVRGLHAAVQNEGTDIALGAHLIASTTDGKVTSIVAGEFTTTAGTLAQINRVLRRIGYAVAAETGTTGAAYLTLE